MGYFLKMRTSEKRTTIIRRSQGSGILLRIKEIFKYCRHFMPNFIIVEKSQLGANKNNLSISLLLVISLQTSQHGLFDTVYHYFTKQFISISKILGGWLKSGLLTCPTFFRNKTFLFVKIESWKRWISAFHLDKQCS